MAKQRLCASACHLTSLKSAPPCLSCCLWCTQQWTAQGACTRPASTAGCTARARWRTRWLRRWPRSRLRWWTHGNQVWVLWPAPCWLCCGGHRMRICDCAMPCAPEQPVAICTLSPLPPTTPHHLPSPPPPSIPPPMQAQSPTQQATQHPAQQQRALVVQTAHPARREEHPVPAQPQPRQQPVGSCLTWGVWHPPSWPRCCRMRMSSRSCCGGL